MKFHKFADVFPLMDEQALAELATDIGANGQREPIWLRDNQILDGRNRYLACQIAKVRPKTRVYNGPDPLKFVVSVNLHRRQLTDSQRSMVAARISTLSIGANQHSEGVPIGTSSEMLNTSSRSTKRAKKVIEHGSKALQHAVDSGEVAISKAASVVDLPKAQQLAAARQATPPVALEIPAGLNLDEGWVPDANDDAHLAQLDREFDESVERVMGANDQLKAAYDEIKRQAAEIATLKISRDGFMNERLEAIRYVKKQQRTIEQQQRVIDRLRQMPQPPAVTAEPPIPASNCPRCDGEGCGYCHPNGGRA